jgi:hypothetical protein
MELGARADIPHRWSNVLVKADIKALLRAIEAMLHCGTENKVDVGYHAVSYGVQLPRIALGCEAFAAVSRKCQY